MSVTRESFFSALERVGVVRLVSRARFARQPSLRLVPESFGPLASLHLPTLAAASDADWRTVAPTLDAIPPDPTGWSTSRGEMRALYHLARGLNAHHILEIGTHVGIATAHLAAALIGRALTDLVTLDIVDVNAADAAWSRADQRVPPRELVRSVAPGLTVDFRAESSARYFDRMDGRFFDLVFIDAAHGATDVYRDIAAVGCRLARGGYIVLHDYDPAQRRETRGPAEAVHRILREYPTLGILPLVIPWRGPSDPPPTLAVLGSLTA